MFENSNQIIFMIYQLKKNLRRKVNSVIGDEDVTYEQFEVLNCLTAGEGMKQKDISRKLDKDPATLTKMLTTLEKKNYVVRGMSEKDRRVSNVYITDTGVQKVKDINDIVEVLNDLVMEDFTNKNKTLFKEMVYKMNQSLAS